MMVTFKISGTESHLFGDGLAIWYAMERGQPGPVFGSKDYFRGLGVFIDTYSNHNGKHVVFLQIITDFGASVSQFLIMNAKCNVVKRTAPCCIQLCNAKCHIIDYKRNKLRVLLDEKSKRVGANFYRFLIVFIMICVLFGSKNPSFSRLGSKFRLNSCGSN